MSTVAGILKPRVLRARPFATRFVVDPLAAVLAWVALAAGRHWATPLILSATGLAGVAAALFAEGSKAAWFAGAAIFFASMVVERAGFLAVRAEPASGSALTLVLGHTFAPIRTVVPAAALACAEFAASGRVWVLTWMVLFVLVHYLDWTILRMILKARGAYAAMYQASTTDGDRRLLAARSNAGRAGIALDVFGPDERALLVLCAGPLFGIVEPMLAAVCVIGTAAFWLRLRVDTAVLKTEIAVPKGKRGSALPT